MIEFIQTANQKCLVLLGCADGDLVSIGGVDAGRDGSRVVGLPAGRETITIYQRVNVACSRVKLIAFQQLQAFHCKKS